MGDPGLVGPQDLSAVRVEINLRSAVGNPLGFNRISENGGAKLVHVSGGMVLLRAA